MRSGGDGVQFDDLVGAAWRSDNESAWGVVRRSGSTAVAIMATRTAARPAGVVVGEGRRERRTRSTGRRATRSGSITPITSALIGLGGEQQGG
jgi:hypothetical protein